MSKSGFATVVQRVAVRKYQPFEGANTAQMQRLLTGKDQQTGEQVDVPRELISPKQLMKVRLEGSDADKEYLRGVYVDVNLAVIPNPSGGEVKYVHAHPAIQELNANSRLQRGALPVVQSQYDDHEGFVLTGDEVQAFRSNNYTLPDRRRAFWEFAAEGDLDLAKAYEEDICASTGYDFNQAMGMWLSSTKGLRLLCVGSVDGYYRSYAYGNYILGDYIGLLVGVAPEARVAREGEIIQPTLDEVLALGNEHVSPVGREAFRKAAEALYQ